MPFAGHSAAGPTKGIASRASLALVALASAASLWLAGTRLELRADVVDLLPTEGQGAALRRWVRAFGGSDLATVLVRGASPDDVARAADDVVERLRGLPSVKHAATRLSLGAAPDPAFLWRHAGPAARASLANALTDEGIRQRVAETRALLLAPGGGAAAELVTADPLRLGALVAEQRPGPRDPSAGVRPRSDGAFATDDGSAQLVLVAARGQALAGADAAAFASEVAGALAVAREAHPGARLDVTGGHAIAAETAAVMRRDLERSSALATALASLAFTLLFGRLRALFAVLPPLLVGTLWTLGLAALWPGGLSAVAVGFTSVVVGVGFDTGVHVYAALLEARREGLSPFDAARRAQARTVWPTLAAAGTAALAFAALGLSELRALRQLGLLCAAGEVLTALAILALTPWLGALVERGSPPPARAPAWTERLARLTSTPARAMVILACSLAPALALAALGGPRTGEALVAVRPRGLPSIATQDAVYDSFGGRRGQWVVLLEDADAERARERADALAAQLAPSPHVESVDAPMAFAPSVATQKNRLAALRALDPPGRAAALERALDEAGFELAPFGPAIDRLRSPSEAVTTQDDVRQGPSALFASRYFAQADDRALAALYVHPRPGAEREVEALIREADPQAALTGYARFELALAESLRRELPRTGLVAAALVGLALWGALRRLRDAVLAASVLAIELAAVLLAARVFGIPLHVYDALVIPVLLGVTVDEAMFLLHRVRSAELAASLDSEGPVDPIGRGLAQQGRSIAATALTTAAGFGALAACRFDGLADLGRLGALGSVLGFAAAVLVVPAGLRLAAWAERGGGRAAS